MGKLRSSAVSTWDLELPRQPLVTWLKRIIRRTVGTWHWLKNSKLNRIRLWKVKVREICTQAADPERRVCKTEERICRPIQDGLERNEFVPEISTFWRMVMPLASGDLMFVLLLTSLVNNLGRVRSLQGLIFLESSSHWNIFVINHFINGLHYVDGEWEQPLLSKSSWWDKTHASWIEFHLFILLTLTKHNATMPQSKVKIETNGSLRDGSGCSFFDLTRKDP